MKQLPLIFITGATGMVGMRLVEIFARRGFRVLAGYRTHTPNTTHKNITPVQIDITNKDSVLGILEKYPTIKAIIHCAAITEVNFCETHQPECTTTNVDGTRHITILARRSGAVLVYISTPMVFAGTRGGYREHDLVRPMNHYARTKRRAEQFVLRYQHGLVVRVNPIGRRPAGAHPSFVQWFIERAQRNESFQLFSDVLINPVSTATLGRMLVSLIQRFKPGIIHLGSAAPVNKAEIWDFIRHRFPKFFGHTTLQSVSQSEAGHIAQRPSHMWLNVDASRRRGIHPPHWRAELQTVLKELGIPSPHVPTQKD